MKRSPIRPVSKKRHALMRKRKSITEQVFERDGYLCRANRLGIGKCHGLLTPHELLNRQRAGRRDDNLLDPDGIITLCSFHNGWVEDNPLKAVELGLAIHSWDDPSAPGRRFSDAPACSDDIRSGADSSVLPSLFKPGAAHSAGSGGSPPPAEPGSAVVL